MTDEAWNALKPGDIIRRGHDQELLEVMNVTKGKKGKPNSLDLRQIARPPMYTAREPKAYTDAKGE